MTADGVRPRQLGRSARRDLAGHLKRLEMGLAGVDMLIPKEHFEDPAQSDRALDAVRQAAEMASELFGLVAAIGNGQGPVVTVRPPEDVTVALLSEFDALATLTGARIGLMEWPVTEALRADSAPSGVGVSFDPASAISAGGNPVDLVGGLGSLLLSARLSDTRDGARVAAGAGSLDTPLYEAGVSVTGYRGPLIVDVRAVASPGLAAERLSGAPRR